MLGGLLWYLLVVWGCIVIGLYKCVVAYVSNKIYGCFMLIVTYGLYVVGLAYKASKVGLVLLRHISKAEQGL